MNNQLIFRNILILLLLINIVSSYHVDIVDNGPIVKGATITFTAILYKGNRVASGSYIYKWEDNAIPTHRQESTSETGMDTWSVEYNASVYPAGPYVAQVTVCYNVFNFYCPEEASNRIIFHINETLNGNIALIQNNNTLKDIFVSNSEPVVHNVTLKKTDSDFVKGAPTVLTYWFVDCTYYGFRRSLEFPFNYTQADRKHFVEALVIADFTPLPPPTTVAPTTTTTTSTTKPTTHAINVTTSTSTTPKPQNTTTVGLHPVTIKSVVKREVNDGNQTNAITIMVNGSLVPYHGSFPYVCNGSRVAMVPSKTYGYFYKTIKVRAPISKVNITGNNWLQHGELLTLNVKCHGSKNLKYCVLYERGVYNITGNETCNNYLELDICEFTIQRYFGESMEHTIIIIIKNEVSKKVTPVTVTVYKVKKQAQLSVIVVPVAFSLVAVVLIVFGVAYYIQSRSRFGIEVADFNFGQNCSDLEYKTFKERLRDSIANAFFTRAPSPSSSEVPVWPPGRKYGSMTS